MPNTPEKIYFDAATDDLKVYTTHISDDDLQKASQLYKQFLDDAFRDLPGTASKAIEQVTAAFEKFKNTVIESPALKDVVYTAVLGAFEMAKQQILSSVKSKPAPIAVKAKPIKNIEYPLDKINSTVWTLSPDNTQILLAAESKNSNQELNISYSINFDDLGDNLKISKQLTPFDKRVYVATSSLFNTSGEIVSLTQIHHAMGNSTLPKSDQLKKINDSITKMRSATIIIDNSDETKAYKYPQVRYQGSLLPSEQIEAVVNGQITSAAIHFFREPTLMTFAKGRKQLTTIPIELLQSPINKTNDNLQLEDYLISRISKAKRQAKKQERILLKTIYEKANIKTQKQKTRLPEKIERLLSHQIQKKFILKYKLEKDALTVWF